MPGRCHFLWLTKGLREREIERERGRLLLAERGEGWLEVTAEKHLVGDAFNVRQRAVVVVIGGF